MEFTTHFGLSEALASFDLQLNSAYNLVLEVMYSTADRISDKT